MKKNIDINDLIKERNNEVDEIFRNLDEIKNLQNDKKSNRNFYSNNFYLQKYVPTVKKWELDSDILKPEELDNFKCLNCKKNIIFTINLKYIQIHLNKN